jgi:phosphatidylglycerophosphatase A
MGAIVIDEWVVVGMGLALLLVLALLIGGILALVHALRSRDRSR